MNDLVESPGIGHNRPPTDLAPEDERVADLIEAATKWAEQYPAIEAEDVAAACTDYINQLDAQWEEFERRRKAEKKPLDDAIRAVQARWLPRLERIDVCRRALKPLHRAWLKLKDARLRADREVAERELAEAQRRADRLAEQAAAGGPGAVADMIGAAEAAAEADKARQAVAAAPRRAQVRGSLGGRTHSLRTVWLATVVEQDRCYQHFRDHADVKDVLQRLANAAARSGVRNPNLGGCWVFSEET